MMQATILIIEDNATTAKLLKVALSNAGYVVLDAENGEQALELMQTTSPDLILQDLMLPDIEGVDLNRKLRELPNGRDIPIIALSGFLNKIEELKTSYLGFTTYLIKPIEPSHLIKVIKNYLPVPLSEEEKVGKGQSILIVDDDPVQLKLLSLHLKNVGFNTRLAIDGDDALQQAREHPPAAIVSDIFMPCLDGFELCLKIRQDPKLAQLPFILIFSQYFTEQDKELAKRVGVNNFVLRTEDFKEITSALLNSLKSPAPTLSTVPDQLFKDEHIHSIIRQLEHQVITSNELKQRSALQNAQLSLLKAVVNMMTSKPSSVNTILENVITSTLDATGISHAALYLIDEKNKIFLQQLVGYNEEERIQVANFFGFKDLLQQTMTMQQTILIPSAIILPQQSQIILNKAKVNEGLLIPLVSTNEQFGVLFLGSRLAHVINQDFVNFALALGKQIGQTIALTNAFKQLSISEQRNRILMDKTSCGIIICNREGIILEINHEIEKLLGEKKKNIIGKSYKMFVVSSDQDYSAVLWQKLLIEKSIGPIEGRIQQSSGVIRDIEYTIDCIEIGGELLLFAIINDKTQSNRLHAQALLSDKLATVGKLAAGIVHEINNPLTWLLSNLIFIKDMISHSESQELVYDQLHQLEEMLNESIAGTHQIRDIVRNLKSYARIDEEISTYTDVHEILDAAIKIAYPSFKHCAKIEKNYADNIPKSLLMQSKLQQVFLNLIVNAAQAISGYDCEKNKIIVKTSLEEKRIRIDVSDTGSGIDPDVLPKIFEPFFTTKIHESGSGLGLSICNDIICRLGGEIQVETVPGMGSTFSVFVPLGLTEQPVEKISVTNTTYAGRILAIDDEPSLLKTLQRILEPIHQVTTALGGKEAIDILVKNPYSFDIIISDVSMPDINGIDIYRFIANKQPGLERHIVFISGGADLALHQKFMAEVDNPCIEKPFTKEDLLRIVNEMLATRAGVSTNTRV